MHQGKYHTPPILAQRFLRWFCKPALVEDIAGDLEEDFNDFVTDYGLGRARYKYWLAVIRFLKPFAIKKIHITTTQTIMFKNYFKTSIRSIARNRLFSAINIIGLAISMSVCLLMISFISELFSYDKFHENPDRIHRVISYEQFLQNEPQGVAATSILTGKRLQAEVPGIEASVILNRRFAGDASFQNKTVSLKGLWASKSFFEVLSGFTLLQGNAETALLSPNSVVLTEEAATRIFGTANAMGQTIEIRSIPFTVTGIAKQPPFNSHISFEALGSMVTYENMLKQRSKSGNWLKWTNVGNDYVYLLLDEGTEPGSIQASLDKMSEEENLKIDRFKIYPELQALTSIMPGPALSNNIGKSMDSSILSTLFILTTIVILCAAFNYTNLSVARAFKRSKEIGVRKVVGANKGQIFWQFILEAIIISLTALCIAILLFYLIRPEFLNIDPMVQQATKMIATPALFAYFLVFSVFVGLMAGFFPAVHLSKLKSTNALKNAPGSGLLSRMNMRKVLVVIQFSLSLIFIISATISFKQYKYAVAFDLGYNTENILSVRLQGVDPTKVATAFEAIPAVNQVARSFDLNGLGNGDRTRVTLENSADSAYLYYNFVDENFIPLMEHKLLAGANFESRPGSREESIIINERTLRKFNIESPSAAIDQYIQLIRGPRLRIIGVVEDFVYTDISRNIHHFGFRYSNSRHNYINLKLNPSDLVRTMERVESAWNAVADGKEFQAEFYDQKLQSTYSQYATIYTIVGFLAFITISIAVLGLLGMAIYTAETRLKEISVRKILGASEASLVKLLARGFIWMLAIAALIAVPLSYYLFDSVVLSESVNRISIGITELFSGVLFIFLIGFVTIASQTWKTAKSNPAQTLRSE
ncbi:MAG: FtsX-like permease family protein [Roseivirga sp.]|nr:FtsX-like permease family protein [Roseivirga sp.]